MNAYQQILARFNNRLPDVRLLLKHDEQNPSFSISLYTPIIPKKGYKTLTTII